MNEKFNVIGCEIAALSMEQMIDSVLMQLQRGDGGYVCFTNVHASVMARENIEFKRIVNQSFLSVADGKPVYWVGKLKGYKAIEQIPGPDFFPRLLQAKKTPPLRHYFYGGKQEVLDKLIEKVRGNYPNAEIVGAESPPFRDLSTEEIKLGINRIKESNADIVWVGLGAPKQEQWMSRHWQELKPAVLFGVGAAFDFHAETVKRAPKWARYLGLEWLHRLLQEPGRLWKTYFYTNTMFLLYVIKDVLFFNKKQ